MFLKYFLLLTFVNISLQIHPRYSYVCKENGTVEFKGFKSDSTIKIIESKNSSCNGTLHKNANVSVLISKHCMGIKLKAVRTIKIQVNDGNVKDGAIKEHSVGVHDTSKIIGGLESHTFTLTCNPITDVHRTVLRQFHLKDQEVIYEKDNEIASVDMRFKGTDNINDPDISEAFIGDEFYMFLIYQGESKYKLVPNNCTAYAGNDMVQFENDDGHKQTLWEYKVDHKKFCVSPDAGKFNLMGVDGFTYVSNDETKVKARLNAFRFKDNNDVTIFCDVSLQPDHTVSSNENVCPTQAPTTTPAPTPNPTLPPTQAPPLLNGGRKKRALNSQLNTRVMKSISIKEKHKDYSNQGILVTPSLVLHMVSSIIGVVVMKKVSQ